VQLSLSLENFIINDILDARSFVLIFFEHLVYKLNEFRTYTMLYLFNFLGQDFVL
jgi:hypothetical protein